MKTKLTLGVATDSNKVLGTITAPTTGSGAPTTSSYLTLATDTTLTNERVLTAGTGIAFTDGGPGGTLTIASSAAASNTAMVTVSADPNLSAERVLTAGTNVTITDGGANGNITVSTVVQSQFNDRVMMSSLHASTTQTQTSGTASYVYVGRTYSAAVWKFVKFRLNTVGAGAQTGEVGLFSSTNAPNGTAQTLTKIWADSTLDSLTVGTGIKKNTTASAVSVPAGTHLWAACRFAMATTQPNLAVLIDDWQLGYALQQTGSASLTTLTTVTPSLLAAVTTLFPDLRVTLD